MNGEQELQVSASRHDPSTDATSPSSADSTKVLYVLGHPRCGSTIFGNVLAEMQSVFHAGELHYLWTPDLPVPRQRCGCGELVRDCPLWRKIFAVAFDTRDDALPRTAAAPAAAPAWGLPGVDAVELHDLQRRALARSRRGGAGAAEEYLRVMESIYRAIAEVTGSRLVVDSSKWPRFARLVAEAEEADVAFVHLIREPWGAVFSRLPRDRSDRPGSARPPGRGRVLLESLRWLESNLRAERIAKRSGRRWLTVPYEDFTTDPATTLSRVSALAGLSPPLEQISDREVLLTVNHTTGGNRNRWQSGKVEIRRDRRWRGRMRRSDVHLVSLATWPYRLRYGYHP